MINTSIFCIIISEFSYGKESSPIILFVIDKSLEISLNCGVLSLDLAISLRVKSSRELLLDSKEVA